MNKPEEDKVALKLLHTADWHIGRRFPSFDDADQVRLTRARLEVLDRILLAADRESVDAVLCAGDLFDHPSPDKEWWEPVAEKLASSRSRNRIFLLPGNHDPLQPGSVYGPGHPFRARLPDWVEVVDRDDYSFALNDVAVLYARPCRSQAGQDDPALALPDREPGDERIRIGMVHGSTFDAADCQLNFPIDKDAAAIRGLDYLAIGDTHSFRCVPPGARPPVVYPGAPEPTSFDEPGAGNVVRVFVSHSRRVTYQAERVATWTWAARQIHRLDELRQLAVEPNLSRTVLRLSVDLRLPAQELEQAEALLRELKGTRASHGRVGILQFDKRRLVLDSAGIEDQLAGVPDVVRAAVLRLKAMESGEQGEVARTALRHLYQLVTEAEAG